MEVVGGSWIWHYNQERGNEEDSVIWRGVWEVSDEG